MSKQKKNKSDWVLVHVDDLPVPSPELLDVLRCGWVGADVLFLVAPGRWHRGKVYEITRRGEVKIAVKRGDTWVHRRVICFEYIPRVLRRAIYTACLAIFVRLSEERSMPYEEAWKAS